MRHLHALGRLSYGHGSSAGLPDIPPPNPWVMGVVLIGAGLTLWWLTPTMVQSREESSRTLWGDGSSYERWPHARRGLDETATRVASILMVVVGIITLADTALGI